MVNYIDISPHKLDFFDLFLSLDAKVDYLDLLDSEDAQNNFWEDMKEKYRDNDDEYDRRFSEVTHHQYFHLEDKEETASIE